MCNHPTTEFRPCAARYSLAYMVMMIWNLSLTNMLIEGIPDSQKEDGPMYYRLLFTYAASLTAVCGFATVRIVRCRRSLVHATSLELSSAAREGKRRASAHSADGASPSTFPPPMPFSPAAKEGKPIPGRIHVPVSYTHLTLPTICSV